MPNKAGARTHDRILDAAESLILTGGYGATSIDQIIEQVGVTKGTFFYHFKSKDELARSLVDRYAVADRRLLEENLRRAEALSKDPVQRLLIFVGLFIEMAEGMREPAPGCLFASYCYESRLFDEEIHEVVAEAILRWREEVGRLIRAAVQARPPLAEVDVDSLADLLTGVFEGAYILARTLKEPGAFAAQLRHYRTYLELLFGGGGDARGRAR